MDLEPGEWVKDIGCTNHMTGNRKLFSSYQPCSGGNITFGSKLKGNIIGKGTITHNSLTITNVEHVDNLGFNILSISQICDNKCKVIFPEDGSEIIKDGKVISKGVRKGNLYVMKISSKPSNNVCLATINDNSICVSYNS